MSAILESQLLIYSYEARVIYQAIIWPIVVIGTLANLGVIYRIAFISWTKNSILRPFYRAFIVSLALSDLLLLVSSGSNTLSSQSNRVFLWYLPDWACTVIPFFQTVAVLTNSLLLSAIAIDRYTAMKPKYPISKGIKWPYAILFVILVWSISAAASHTLIGAYSAETIIVINNSSYYRHIISTTYAVLFAVIFLPLAIVFVTVYILLALNIWKRRSPGERSQLGNSSDSQFTDTSTASTSASNRGQSSFRRPMPTPAHVTRKKRTVKMILLLIIIFVMSKLPHWIFLLYKLYATINGIFWWHLQTILTILSLLNSVVNPFLYAFLNEALSLCSWIGSCCSRKDTANLVTTATEKRRNSITSIKVPRGPYSN
ncbi:QRFP-like peptide receptor isoform X2 [Cephus cinctus]|uniref:QRFP-like peptide receptor isoform X2 n=1 Tax=Cephus cinctus TaxID=211228 RepID=A0AAJ7RHF0_CEPCN|nr:QRFP-like peptide receptor isoform X2 [Cephus cinctus]